VSIQSTDAASFGFLFNADGNLRAHRLKFVQAGPSWTAVLLESEIALDDFWADQYGLYIPRPVDGPEIIRHEGLHISGGITMLLRGHLLECFVCGRSISYRLPTSTTKADGQTNGHANGINGHGDPVEYQKLGVFVEDGAVELNLSISPLEIL
jgi:beta-fructofuranosidase